MPKLFKSPLQTIIHMRELEEENKAISLRRSRQDLDQEKNVLKGIENRKDELLRSNSNDNKFTKVSINNHR